MTTALKAKPRAATMKHPPHTDAEWDRIEAKQAERMEKMNRLCARENTTLEAGMRFAIGVMKLLQEENADLTSADQTYVDNTEKGKPRRYYRRGPQSKLLWRALAEINRGMFQEAVSGFAIVMTDFLGQVLNGNVPDPEFYEKEFNTFQRWKLNKRGDPV